MVVSQLWFWGSFGGRSSNESFLLKSGKQIGLCGRRGSEDEEHSNGVFLHTYDFSGPQKRSSSKVGQDADGEDINAVAEAG